MTITNDLLALVAANVHGYRSLDHLLDEIRSPDWGHLGGFTPTWGEFVPEPVQDRWTTLPFETQLMLYLVAQAGADRAPEEG
jgi:hypothetical protein